MPRVTGPFDVRLGPLEHSAGDATLGRLSIDKQYHGDLQGTAKGEMLTAGTAVTGSFALHHTGVMTRGAPTLTVTVVPDSGTDGLEGIAGRLDIIFEGQQHVYVLDYTLPGD
jgi:hypothetical protein